MEVTVFAEKNPRVLAFVLNKWLEKNPDRVVERVSTMEYKGDAVAYIWHKEISAT